MYRTSRPSTRAAVRACAIKWRCGVDEVTVTLFRLPPKLVDDLIEKLRAHPGVVAVDS